jgi:hypothetical protein
VRPGDLVKFIDGVFCAHSDLSGKLGVVLDVEPPEGPQSGVVRVLVECGTKLFVPEELELIDAAR